MPTQLSNPPDSPRSRSLNSQKKHKPNHISAIQQNLKLMKNQAEQFLKKGNKQLPPITKPRHYLYLNFLKQNLTLSEIANDDKSLTLKDPPNPNIIKNQTEAKPYSKRNNLSQKKPSHGEKNPQESESIIVIKRNNREFIKIVREEPISEVNELTGKSVQLSIPKTVRQTFDNFKTLNSAEFKGNWKKRSQSPSSIQFIDQNITKLRHTQQISGNIINSLHSENLSLRYSKINPSRQVIVKQMVPISPKNLQIKDGSLEEIIIKQRQKKEKKHSAKYLFGQKVLIKQKPKTISHQTVEPKIDLKRKKILYNKVESSILDHIFAPTKNILNQKSQQFKRQNQQQNSQILSSDSIDIKQQRLETKIQGMRRQGSHLFNPLRSTNLLKESGINDSLLCSELRNSLEIPRALQNLPLSYKKKWIQELEVSIQKLSNSRLQSLERTSGSVIKDENRTHSLWRRPSNIQNKLFQHRIIRKSSLEPSKNNPIEKWQPWSSNEILQNVQNYDFGQIIKIQQNQN